MNAVLDYSNRRDKRFKITLNGKIIHFGQYGASTYIDHKNPSIKKHYIARHSVLEDWKNPYTAGFWSRWILWNYTTVPDSIADIKKRFNITIKSELKADRPT